MSQPRAYLSVRAQYDNLGDLEIRRRVVRWAEPVAHLHVLVGDAPRSFVDALALPVDARLYQSEARWASSFLGARRPAAMLWSPGEYSLRGPRGLVNQAAAAGLTSAAAGRGLAAIRIGRSLGEVGRPHLALERLNARMAHTWWRDARSRQRTGGGELMPDIAFEDEPVPRTERRSSAALSFRGDRPAPDRQSLLRLAESVRERGLEPVCVSQVGRDDRVTETVANVLHCDAVPFAGRAHADQERLLSDVYARTSVVVSDRFHVLVLGARLGAVPVAVENASGTKMARNLGAVGLQDWVSADVGTATDALPGLLAPDAVSVLRQRLSAAAHELRTVRSAVTALISG